MYFEIDSYNALKAALNTFCKRLAQIDIPQETVFDSKLVADELLSNALQHGGGKAYFSVDVDGDIISLSVRSLHAFRPPEKSVLASRESESGRGLFIVDRIVETRRYSEEGGTSVIIRIRK